MLLKTEFLLSYFFKDTLNSSADIKIFHNALLGVIGNTSDFTSVLSSQTVLYLGHNKISRVIFNKYLACSYIKALFPFCKKKEAVLRMELEENGS